MKVLIVDDSLVVRTIIENAIKPIGYEAIHAGNGKEAMDIIEKQAKDINLVLLDWNMPVQDGFETVKCIRQNDAYNHLCILMISTESEDEKIGQALDAGAQGYLAKPFSTEELASKIKQTMEKFGSK
jgi:two-component system chemotaxis response regulator CheY